MPSDSDNPGIDAILAAGAQAHQAFVADSKAMDAAWQNGTFDEWLKQKLEGAKEEHGDVTAGNRPGLE